MLVNRLDRIPEQLLPLLKMFMLLGILGTAVTLVAMEYFLFAFDRSSAFMKVFWFCAMLVPLLGLPLYCFFVYLRSEPVQKASAASSTV